MAQLLLLFSLQGGSGIDSLVTYDYSRALVTAQMKTLDAEQMAQVISQVEQFLAQRYNSGSALQILPFGDAQGYAAPHEPLCADSDFQPDQFFSDGGNYRECFDEIS